MNMSSQLKYMACAVMVCMGQSVVHGESPAAPDSGAARDRLASVGRPQPNIVHILTDDLGWQDVACYYREIHGEEPVYETPHIDRIAQNGMRFMQAYSPAPTCAPSRAAYMAGQYTSKTGVLHVLGGRPTRPYTPRHAHVDPIYPSRIGLDTPTIASVLKTAGYLTAHIQKWHFGGLNNGYPGPLQYGFDFGWQQNRGITYNDPTLWVRADKKRADFQGIWRPMLPHRLADFPSSHDPKVPYALDADDRPYDSVVDLSLRWMDKVKEAGQPFFMNFCPSFVHGPIATRDRKRLEYYCDKMGLPFPEDPGKFSDVTSGQVNPYYAAMVDSLDWQVGQILSFLETTDDPRNPGHKLIENTYIMVSSDNGGLRRTGIVQGVGKGTPEPVTDNTPLRGGKLTTYEGGLRIPFIIQGPGIAANSSSDTPINLVDLFPTYMAMAGVPRTAGLELDGANILPVLCGQRDDVQFADGKTRDAIFFHYPIASHPSSIIRKGGWKLIHHYDKQPQDELYQLYKPDGSVCDLGEATNLADHHPQKRDELLADLNAWLKRSAAPMPYRNAHKAAPALPHAEQVPAVTRIGSAGTRVEAHFEVAADKAVVVEAQLLYTTNGSDVLRDHPGYEEWFIAPAHVGDGMAYAAVPPGTTHAILYVRDANGFLITSEPVPARFGSAIQPWVNGTAIVADGYAYRPGLLALIECAESAHRHAQASQQAVSALHDALLKARAVVQQPVAEEPYAVAMRALRREIRALDVPEAKLEVLNQFGTEKW